MEEKRKPKVGVMIAVINSNEEILLGLRKDEFGKALSSSGKGIWTMPGGKLEYGESLEEGAIREVKEETDLDIDEIQVYCVQNDINDFAHFITIGLITRKWKGVPKPVEYEELEEWKWFNMNKLPNDVFISSLKCIQKLKSGVFY